MSVKTVSGASSDRKKWGVILGSLLKMLHSQKEQIENLVKERKIIKDRLNMQQECLILDTRVYEDRIFQLEAELEVQEIWRKVDAAKADLISGLKRRDAFLCKLKLEDAEDLLGDFKAWFDFHTKSREREIVKTNKGMARGKDSSSNSSSSRTLEGEVSRLEYENLASESSSQITALLAENNFVWNQFKLLETELTNKLKSKHAELEKAKKDIEVLISSVEELKSSNIEKDKTIERLKDKVSQKEKEVDATKCHEKISSKHAEREKATKDIEELVSRVEELKSSNIKKDEIIERLRDKVSESEADENKSLEKVTRMSKELEMLKSSNIDKDQIIEGLKVELSQKEADVNESHEQISRMSKDLEQLRTSNSVITTPLLRCCKAGGKVSVLGVRNGDCDTIMKKNFLASQVSYPSKDSQKRSRSSKRKLDDDMTRFETPKLFTSAFTVPKLKTAPPRSR